MTFPRVWRETLLLGCLPPRTQVREKEAAHSVSFYLLGVFPSVLRVGLAVDKGYLELLRCSPLS